MGCNLQNDIHKRNLPHLYFPDGKYFITYRLANTFHSDKPFRIKTSQPNCDSEKFKTQFIEYDTLLDSAKNYEKYLKEKQYADICKDTIHYPDGKDYKLICYCIMPNHIHLIFELLPGNKGIGKIMQSVKGISAKRCNLLIGREGNFWQDESYDRWIRDDKELYYFIRYILLNPVNAGLLQDWKDWEYTFCNPRYLVL
jgi:REP element-mobilizing transposase RayT